MTLRVNRPEVASFSLFLLSVSVEGLFKILKIGSMEFHGYLKIIKISADKSVEADENGIITRPDWV